MKGLPCRWRASRRSSRPRLRGCPASPRARNLQFVPTARPSRPTRERRTFAPPVLRLWPACPISAGMAAWPRLQCFVCGQLVQYRAGTDSAVVCLRCGVANACGEAGLAAAPRASPQLLPPSESSVSFMMQIPHDAQPLQLFSAVVEGQAEAVQVQIPVNAIPGTCVKVTAPLKKVPAPSPAASLRFQGCVLSGCAPPSSGNGGPASNSEEEAALIVHQSSSHCVAAVQPGGQAPSPPVSSPPLPALHDQIESKDDLMCSICFELLIKPIRTHCNHR